jgi:hypothetical protein
VKPIPQRIVDGRLRTHQCQSAIHPNSAVATGPYHSPRSGNTETYEFRATKSIAIPQSSQDNRRIVPPRNLGIKDGGQRTCYQRVDARVHLPRCFLHSSRIAARRGLFTVEALWMKGIRTRSLRVQVKSSLHRMPGSCPSRSRHQQRATSRMHYHNWRYDNRL